MSEHEDHIDGGIDHDLPRLLTRRKAVGGLLGTASLAFLAACGSNGTTTTAATTQSAPQGGAPGGSSNGTVAAGEIPEETAGPYPGDGSNGANVLTESGVVRSDITTSFAGATGKAEGIPMTVTLKVLDVTGSGSAPLVGAAIYLWHCDAEGRYSLYSQGVTEENYLRGVQETASDGTVTFQTIVPACYDGRWPHMHFEVYPSVAKATSSTNKLRTSQLAVPKDVCDAVYATAGYEASVSNLNRVSLDTDGIFSDGYSLQLAKVTGNTKNGYTATLTVPV